MRPIVYFLLSLITVCGSAQERERIAPLIDANTANLPTQPIGPNDLLAVSVYGSPELTRTVRVSADGLIRLPMLKQSIKCEGLMPSDVENAIAETLKSAELLVDPLVTVTVVEYKSRPINVMGAVRKPLLFQAIGPTTLLEALARAEGLSEHAGPDILVSRMDDPDGLVRRIPVKDLLHGSDPALNLKLTGGEDVRVPEAENIFVVGNIRKPGAFAVGGDTQMTVLKAVALSEGLVPFAAKQAVIYRREATGSTNELVVDLGKIMDRKTPDFPLVANDVLYVPDSKGRRATWTTVERLLLFGSGATTAAIYATVH